MCERNLRVSFPSNHERPPLSIFPVASRGQNWLLVILASEYLRILLELKLVSQAPFLTRNSVINYISVAELLKQGPFGLPMKQDVATYWRKNIFETSSGNFATDLLKFHIGQIGLDRIMYSIDYPYVRAHLLDLFCQHEALTPIFRSIWKMRRHGSILCPKVS